jgi:MFS family permease
MMAFHFPLWIFFARTIDRFGLRTGARDAMLSDEATPRTKGKIFGFHRSMDTLGAVLGPSLALLYLYFYPENYTTCFTLRSFRTFAIAATFVKEKKNGSRERSNSSRFGLLDGILPCTIKSLSVF